MKIIKLRNQVYIHNDINNLFAFNERSRKIKEKRKREERQISGENEFMIQLSETPSTLVFEKLSFVKNIEDADERQKGNISKIFFIILGYFRL